MTKPANKLEKWWMDKIITLGCIIPNCGRNDVSCHHINSGQKRMGHIFTLPLCWGVHHEGGKLSVGNDKKEFKLQFGSELKLLLDMRPMLLARYPEDREKFKEVFRLQDDRIYRGKIKYVI